MTALIDAYRAHGHRISAVNPISLVTEAEIVPELESSRYGLDENQKLSSLDGLVSFNSEQVRTVSDLQVKLTETYCTNVSAEFTFIESEYEREWFAENFEKLYEEKRLITNDEKRKLAKEMLEFQEFDRFMNAKLPSIKRYGGEGAESMVGFFRTLMNSAANEGIDTIVLGMPNRGKLNSLVTLFKQRPVKILRKYRGLPEFGDDAKAMMDIPNHFSKFDILLMNARNLL